jgi:PleD family two-component response regulator
VGDAPFARTPGSFIASIPPDGGSSASAASASGAPMKQLHQSASLPPAPSPLPCVLVVDDAAINRKIMVKALGSSYRIDQAENGLEAVQMVEANPNKYCCVLMDLMMVSVATAITEQTRGQSIGA